MSPNNLNVLLTRIKQFLSGGQCDRSKIHWFLSIWYVQMCRLQLQKIQQSWANNAKLFCQNWSHKFWWYCGATYLHLLPASKRHNESGPRKKISFRFSNFRCSKVKVKRMDPALHWSPAGWGGAKCRLLWTLLPISQLIHRYVPRHLRYVPLQHNTSNLPSVPFLIRVSRISHSHSHARLAPSKLFDTWFGIMENYNVTLPGVSLNEDNISDQDMQRLD